MGKSKSTSSALVIYDDDRIHRSVLPKDGREFTLEELYELTECDCVQFLQMKDNNGRSFTMVMDDNGKLDCSKGINMCATTIARVLGALAEDDVIDGTVLLAPSSMID